MHARFAVLFLVAVILAGLAPATAADTPPRNLKWVGDHWTAWDPPQVEPGPQVHTIVRGDTLWDLAARFYGDPYLWPQLWERNQYILDAHWIYPGDPLVIGFEVTPVEDLTDVAPGPGTGLDEQTEQPSASEQQPVVLSSGAAAGAPGPLGAESDIYCTGFIGEPEEEFPYAVIGSEFESLSPNLFSHRRRIVGRWGTTDAVKFNLWTGDIVYLSGGRLGGLRPGQVFTAIMPDQDLVRHPLSRDVVGRLYRYTGRVRVLSVQEESAIAEIVHTCQPGVLVGTGLVPFEPEPVPLGRSTAMRPINFPTSAERLVEAPVVLVGNDDVVSLAQDHVVFIEGGADADVTPGDVFTIYRLNRVPGMPPIVLGELAVLSVHERTSVAKILESRYPIYAGDRLDPK